MRNIFELTKSEQRIVIAIVTILVAIAFARHLWQTKPKPALKTSFPVAMPPTHPEEDESSDSRD